MKEVTQLVLHGVDADVPGDCFRATIASLLDMPAEDVPHFLHGVKGGEWMNRLNVWLGQRGLAYIEFDMADEGVVHAWRAGMNGCGMDVYHSLCGPSPRFPAELHNVVGRNGDVVWDPHPERKGLAGDATKIGFIVKTCHSQGTFEEKP